uniref:Carboxylesterase type B domain-containing protein n=1 Tax=Lutzomyia longipalpis TaxID=7200 RepID=A0A1B0EU02_LUTLO
MAQDLRQSAQNSKTKPQKRISVRWRGLAVIVGVMCVLPVGIRAQWDQYTTRDPRFYSRDGVNNYNPPNPGDPEYRTYTYNDRRYGYYQPAGYGHLYPGQKLPGQYPNPHDTPLGDDRFKFDPSDPNTFQTPFPGVLGGWREDLQGKLRRDSLTLDRDVFVTTNYGQVQGFKVYLYDNPDPLSFYRPWHSTVDRIMGQCSVFLGIPYALPPTHEGRFKPPRPHRGWQLMQAVDFGPACPQPVRYTGATKGIRDMDEDCLYLNVFSPKTGSGVPQKYPVMVYIHGGEFTRGASNLFPAHVLASFYEVVVVSINYRLATAEWALTVDKYRAQNTSIVYGKLLGCYIESSYRLVECLRLGRSFYEIANAEFAPDVGFFPWGPVLDMNLTYPGDNWYEGWREKDWQFLKETPEQMIKKGLFNKGLHYMTGVTTQEAAYVLYQNESLAPYFDIDEDFVDQKIRELVLRYNYTLNLNGTYEAIKYMYTHWPDPSNKTYIREEYINLLSDFIYRAPSDQMTKLLVEQNVPVYMYVLNTTVEGMRLQNWRAVPHNIEHYFLTGAPFMDVEFFPKRDRLERNMWTDNDRNMSHFFMKTFSDFARFGNPTPQQVLGLHFDKAINGELRYLNLNTTFNSTIRMNYRQKQCAFWTQYLPTVVGVLVPTYPPSTEYWWEPQQPLQIAFWSISAVCLFLVILLVVCCILWRNAKRQSDRFYDGDVFMVDNTGADGDAGIENISQTHPLRSRENIYEFRDTPKKSGPPTDISSVRSPSSLATNPTAKSGSQSSLKSAISLKEGAQNGRDGNYDRNLNNKGKGSDGKNLLADFEKSREAMTSSPVDVKTSSHGIPIPASRKTVKTSKTQLVEGVPQTEV